MSVQRCKELSWVRMQSVEVKYERSRERTEGKGAVSQDSGDPLDIAQWEITVLRTAVRKTKASEEGRDLRGLTMRRLSH